MSDPLNTANALEADPIPQDVPHKAAIYGDIERGYSREQEEEETPRQSRSASTSARTPRKGSRNGSPGSPHGQKVKKVRGKGLTEGDSEMEELPHNNLPLVSAAIGLVLFLAALDQTIVSTALPTIAEELNASPSEYQWVGTAYYLAMTVQGPINGRVSDIVGRKPMLYAAILFFTVFSAVCGAAKTSTWLIWARAFQGLGGGAIIVSTNIVISDIVPLAKRGEYIGVLGGVWGIASVLGPILGGILTDRASWRWCFYINLPTCGVAFVLLVFTLKVNPTKKLTFRQLLHTFDFVGLFLLMVGGALLIVGFARAADYGFSNADVYGVIIGGALAMVFGIVNCLFTKRNAVIPARMFKNRTTLFFLIASLVQACAFQPANFLLPQMYQGVQGADALLSGLYLIPFAFTVSIGTVIAGQINSRLRIIRPVPWAGYALGGIGYGLFYAYYTYPIPIGIQEGISVVAGLGIGLSLTSQLLILQAAMPLKEMAAVTSAWSLMRSLGGSVGLAVYTAVLNTDLRSRFQQIPGFGTEFEVPQSAEGYHALHDLPDGSTKDAVLTAFADSLRLCWIIGCAMMLFCLAITIPTRSYSLDRTSGPAAAPTTEKAMDETDKGEEADPAKDAHHQDPALGAGAEGRSQAESLHADTPASEKTVTERTSHEGTAHAKAP